MKLFGNVLDGLQVKNPKSLLRVTFDKEFLVLEEMGNKGFKPIVLTTFKIPLSNLQATLATTEKEFIEKSKSVIGRGVAGGVLFGPAGLILGGLSGVGNKKKTNVNRLYIISYLSVDEDIKNITLTLPGTTQREIDSFDRALKEVADFGEGTESNEIIL